MPATESISSFEEISEPLFSIVILYASVSFIIFIWLLTLSTIFSRLDEVDCLIGMHLWQYLILHGSSRVIFLISAMITKGSIMVSTQTIPEKLDLPILGDSSPSS